MSLRAGGVIAAALLTITACSDGAGGTHSAPHGEAFPVAPAALAGTPDAVVTGPQGRDPQFVVRCGLSHVAPDDPIVYPGEPGASHMHTFFGNRAAYAEATYDSMQGAATSCEQRLDTASYWAPALLREGRMVEPIEAVAYYRAGAGIDPTTVEAYPPGLMMIAGDPTATSPQPLAVVSWSCGTSSARSEVPPECPAQRGLRLLVTFPDCWDGERLDTVGHREHVHYSSGGGCPPSHPVAIPQLTLTVSYPVSGDPAGLALASGGVLSGHADFVNAWDQDKLATEVRLCLHRGVVCGVSSGRVNG